MKVTALAAVWSLTAALDLLGGLLNGVATLRAVILSSGEAGVFGFGAVSTLDVLFCGGRLPWCWRFGIRSHPGARTT